LTPDANPASRVRGLHLMPFLCLVAKKWRKKGRPDVPSGTSLGGRRGFVAPGRLYGKRLARAFVVVFLFEICANNGA